MYRLHCFGYPMLETADGDRMWQIERCPKRFAILIYLACRRGVPCAQRETLLPVFWPDFDEAHGRNALRQSLFQLRSFLGHGVLVGRDGGELAVVTGRLHCDVWDLRDLLRAGRGLDACEMNPESFLRGFVVRGAEPFMDWVDRTRQGMVVEAIKALVSVADHAEDEDDFDLACAAWRQALELSPHSERLVCHLVAALMATGDRGAAVEAWMWFQERLSADLGFHPTASTRSRVRSTLGLSDPQAPPVPARRPEGAVRVGNGPRRGPRRRRGDRVSPVSPEE